MRLHSVQIHGYRGFAIPQKLRLAQPNNSLGSGLTALVGPNNSGKSAILEVINFLRNREQIKSFEEGQRNDPNRGDVSISFETDTGRLTCKASEAGDAEWLDERSGIGASGEVFPVSPEREMSKTFRLSDDKRAAYATQLNDTSTRDRVQGYNHFAKRIRALSRNIGGSLTQLRRLSPGFPAWRLERTSRSGQEEHYMKVSGHAGTHDSTGLGRGAHSMLHLVDALSDAPPGSLTTIDEPELALHPQAQREFYQILREHSADKQIVIATHSPWLVPLDSLLEGATIARVHLRDGSSNISQISEQTGARLNHLAANKLAPYTLGLEAREVFFLNDGVILTEGLEDVAHYPSALQQLGLSFNASFFGYGVGGKDNMPLFAAVLSELGFRHVAGILDADAASVATELNTRFTREGYQFVAMPTSDVRTKEARKATAQKEGLLDEAGRVRDEFRPDALAALAPLVDYLNRSRH